VPLLTIGSRAHKELFCRVFIDTHTPYDVATIQWPHLDAASLERLRMLPFWDEALMTEQTTAATVQAQADVEHDALLREAVALQGYEEARHARLLRSFLTHYEIPLSPRPPAPLQSYSTWSFVRTEYGECFDAFFAFGLYAIAKDSDLFPRLLVDRFDPILQEEARHILFFVNWLAYRRATVSLWQRPAFAAQCTTALVVQVWSRIQTARGVSENENFTLKGRDVIMPDLSLREFLQVCLQENGRRLEPYDQRLLRPRLVPMIATGMCRILR
jgi:hypothetical protein